MKAKSVRTQRRYLLEIEFEDGTTGEIDLAHLAGKGVFAAWQNPGSFEDVTIGSGGEITWTCGVDLCADSLYLQLTGKQPKEILPGLNTESRVA